LVIVGDCCSTAAPAAAVVKAGFTGVAASELGTGAAADRALLGQLAHALPLGAFLRGLVLVPVLVFLVRVRQCWVEACVVTVALDPAAEKRRDPV
jgi:hypothetical protein